MSVEGGGLDGQYNTAELHFHWGSSNNLGSEHSINGRKYPLEVRVHLLFLSGRGTFLKHIVLQIYKGRYCHGVV